MIPVKFTLSGMGCILALAMTAMTVASAEERFSWQEPHAKVLATGDLEWAPKPFVFEKGASVRYIDFEQGDDENDGTAREKPWKHHPWDAAATGKAKACKGIHTYVFKCGVVYRGPLIAAESGEPRNPIRLTSDPSWGTGEACLFGSQRIPGGWKRCSPRDLPADMPDPDKVWYVDLGKDWVPTCVWQTGGGHPVRIHLARSPNWKASNPDDPQAEWWRWTGPVSKTVLGGWAPREASLVTEDTEHLTQKDPKFYEGAYVWSEWPSNMSLPYASPVAAFDPDRHAIRRARGNSGHVFGPAVAGNRYYIENVLQFLDEPGEFFVKPNSDPQAGRLFIRVPGDRDPNTVVIEAGRLQQLLYIQDQHDIVVSGLRFSFLDVPLRPGMPFPLHYVDPTAIRIIGDCRSITVSNCRFICCASAVRAGTRLGPRYLKTYAPHLANKTTMDFMDHMTVCDNEIVEADDMAITFDDGAFGWGYHDSPTPELGRISILRNKLENVAFRPGGSSNAPAISVNNATLAEIAGNFVNRCWAVGIWALGGKGGGDVRERPLIRMLVHHNRVTNCMLAANDWGGIASWQGGPSYIYNNIVGNPVGPIFAVTRTDKPNGWGYREYSSNAYAIYLDGMYRSFTFNNICWGKYNTFENWIKNRSAFMMVLGFMNHWFNNTVYRYMHGATGGAGQRGVMAGNVFVDITHQYFEQGVEGDVSVAGGGAVAAQTAVSFLSTLGCASNVFAGKAEQFASIGPAKGKDIDSFREAFAKTRPLTGQVGVVAPECPLIAPDKLDFRPKPGSAVADKGVKFFVPWGLYATVGEWSFCHYPADPQLVLGESFFMSDEYVVRDMYYEIPRNDLQIPGATAEDYIAGELEDWTDGALRFDGKTRYGIIPANLLACDYPVSMQYVERKDAKGNPRMELVRGRHLYPGSKRRTVDMDTNSFLVEAYFRTEPGHRNGVLVSKEAASGYRLGINGQGGVELTLKARNTAMALASTREVNDGAWHHVLAEVDRAGAKAILYVDGKKDVEAALKLPADASLSNTGDFLVGKGPEGGYFAGSLDFLRLCRGTLADARTTIEELYAWQFAGPFLRDFCGKAPTGNRDAGAIEIEAR